MKKYIVVILILVACNNYQTRIDDLRHSIDYAETHYEQMDVQDWYNLKVLVDNMEQDLLLNENKYKVQDKKEINKLLGRYNMLCLKKEFEKIQEPIRRIKEQAEGLLEGLNK